MKKCFLNDSFNETFIQCIELDKLNFSSKNKKIWDFLYNKYIVIEMFENCFLDNFDCEKHIITVLNDFFEIMQENDDDLEVKLIKKNTWDKLSRLVSQEKSNSVISILCIILFKKYISDRSFLLSLFNNILEKDIKTLLKNIKPKQIIEDVYFLLCLLKLKTKEEVLADLFQYSPDFISYVLNFGTVKINKETMQSLVWNEKIELPENILVSIDPLLEEILGSDFISIEKLKTMNCSILNYIIANNIHLYEKIIKMKSIDKERRIFDEDDNKDVSGKHILFFTFILILFLMDVFKNFVWT